MPVSTIITAITILILLSLIISGISYSRQQAMAKLRIKISQYRQQSDELLGHIALLLKVDPQYQLITQLQVIAVNTLKLANSLSPTDQIISDNLRIQNQRLSELKEKKREEPAVEFFETETELNQLKSQIAQISKLLEIYRNRGELSIDKSNTYNAHLKKISFELTVNSHMNQARKCGERDDVATYQMHLKQARDLIKKSEMEENEKNKRIKELTDILNEVKKTNKILPESPKKISAE